MPNLEKISGIKEERSLNDLKVDSSLEGRIIAINKPPGITSFTVVKRIRRAVKAAKVGHAGTLDRFAEGVLVVGIGRTATRKLGEYLGSDKEYIAEVFLGTVTDTYDPNGRVVEVNEFSMPDEATLIKLLDRFSGDIMQKPPPFSALKVKGVRMYKLAMKGKKVEAKPRRISIRRIELIGLTDDGFKMRVECSHGTYIRSLAYDIGRELGCGAFLKQLIRTRVDGFSLEDAIDLDDFIERVKASGRMTQ